MVIVLLFVQDGFTAAALAYKAGSTDIIRILNISKAQEFAGSPYSPYALSIASGAASVRSRRSDAQGETLDALLATPLVTKQQAALDSTPADTLSLPGLPSPVSASDWNTPRSRACSIDVPQNPDTNRLTFNSPASGYRMEMTPPLSFLRSPRSSRQPTPDSVQRRLTLVGQSLDEMEGRQRAFSLPANSPTFEAARARSPTDPPLMLFPSSYSADNTPLEGSSPGSTLTGGDAAAAAAAGGRSRPPLAGKKAHRPITSRLRKAAGRAMALIVPSRGIPPRPSVAATHQTSGAGAGASVGSHARTGSVSSVGSATTQADETTEATEATVSEEARTEAGDEAASGTFHDVHSVSDILMGIALEH